MKKMTRSQAMAIVNKLADAGIPMRERDDDELAAGLTVLSEDGKEKGITTGRNHDCRMEGCNGLRLVVKWEDGTRTFPCTKGMTYNENKKTWRIG